MKKIKVGIIGCGAIGTALAKALAGKFSKTMAVGYLCDHHREKVARLKQSLHLSVPAVSMNVLMRKSDLILEAASVEVAQKVARYVLAKNKKALILSVGGLLKIPGLARKIQKSRGRLWVPSGAVAGVDGLLAAREGRLRKVRLLTRKPPKGLAGAPFFKGRRFPALKGKKEVRVFQGTAARAVRSFPQNVNVAAVLSLAGFGAKKTEVEIWTSKKYKRNQHEIQIEGDFGKIQVVVSNRPTRDNPKTSYLAILSATAVLRKILSSYEIGT